MWYFPGGLEKGAIFFGLHRLGFSICWVDYMRYSFQDAQKWLYYDRIKLNSAEIKLYAYGIMGQFLCRIYLYKYKWVMSPKTKYYLYSNVLASLLFIMLSLYLLLHLC